MKKNKRLAYMIRGEYRESRASLHLLKLIHDRLTEHNIDVDFYYIGWEKQLLIAYDNELLGYRKQNKEKIKSDFVKHGFNLVDIQLLEEPILSPFFGKGERCDTIQAQMYLSTEINKMRRRYMATNNIAYDYVYLTRLDYFSTLEYWDSIVNYWVNEEHISMPYWLLYSHTVSNYDFGGLYQGDFHFMGDEIGMNIFCNGFNYIFTAKEWYDIELGHGMMGAYINKRNITLPDIMGTMSRISGELLRHNIDTDAILNAYTDSEIMGIICKSIDDLQVDIQDV